MKNLYFNGHYIVRGYKFFGTIYGRIISTSDKNVFKLGDKVKIKSPTFYKISEYYLKTLKDFGFVDPEFDTLTGK